MVHKLRSLTVRCRTLIRANDHQRGQSLIIVAFLIIALLAAVGLAVDLGLMYVERVRIGRAVDAAALAGAQELPDESAAHDRMVEYLELNGYEEGDQGFSIGWAFPREADCPVGQECAHYHLVVSATQEVGLTFMRVLGFQTVDVSAHAIGENANRLDIAIVLDVSGSMDDDTCRIGGMSNGCDQSWWSEIHDVILEGFEGYNLGDGDSDPDRLCGSNSPWSCNYPWQVGARNDSLRYVGNYGMTEGDGSDGRFYMTFDASSYDQVEVVLRERTYSASTDDYNAAWYSREGGAWTRFMNQRGVNYGSDNWAWQAYLLQGETSQFGIMFGSRYMEAYDYGLWDEIRIRGMVNGPEPSGPLATCPGIAGYYDCAGGGYKKQPIWDTLNAADWFINECQIGTGEDAVPCLDPELDQVGLAYYSDDGNYGNYYPYSNDSATASELVGGDFTSVSTALWTEFDAEGWTNIGDGIYRGCEILSTNEAEGHHGRTNAVHVMILLSDGQPNKPCTYDCSDGNPTAVGHIDNAVTWATQNGIVIFTISLGENADPDLMEDIADATGGTHSYAASTDDLIPIFQEIAQHIFLRLVR
jgi:hypothetical protein